MSIIETAISTFVDRKLNRPAQAASVPAPPASRSLAKGLLAGAIGGAVATAAKTALGKVYPPRTPAQPEPPAVLAEKIAGHELSPAKKELASETIHWAFGIATGAAYGALAEYYPAATSRDGVNFGMTLMALTHEASLPAIGLSAPPANQTQREKTSEIASHVVYGVVTETVRRMLRKVL